MSKYHIVKAGDIIDYYQEEQNPSVPYARCKIVSVTEQGRGVTLQWYGDMQSNGYRTFDPDRLLESVTDYPHYREKVLLKSRTDVRIVIHREAHFNEELFTL
jgi:hypothetical protein